MKPGPAQRGQSLTELALVAPLFALLLLCLSLWARLTLDRLALIQLTRDSAILIARNDTLWKSAPRGQLEAVRELARRQGLLQPQRLELERSALGGLPLGELPGAGSLGASSALQEIVGRFAGRRFTLRYRLPLSGLAARLLPRGMTLEESAAIQGDPWNMQLSRWVEHAYR